MDKNEHAKTQTNDAAAGRVDALVRCDPHGILDARTRSLIAEFDKGNDELIMVGMASAINSLQKLNGEQIRGLCEEFFLNPMIQPYAGARRECMYCGAVEQNDGKVDHSYSDCPTIKFNEIINT